MGKGKAVAAAVALLAAALPRRWVFCRVEERLEG